MGDAVAAATVQQAERRPSRFTPEQRRLLAENVTSLCARVMWLAAARVARPPTRAPGPRYTDPRLTAPMGCYVSGGRTRPVSKEHTER